MKLKMLVNKDHNNTQCIALSSFLSWKSLGVGVQNFMDASSQGPCMLLEKKELQNVMRIFASLRCPQSDINSFYLFSKPFLLTHTNVITKEGDLKCCVCLLLSFCASTAQTHTQKKTGIGPVRSMETRQG